MGTILLYDSSVCHNTWIVDHFTETVQHLFSVIVKVAFNLFEHASKFETLKNLHMTNSTTHNYLVNCLILDHVQCTISFTNKSFVVRHNDYATFVFVDGFGKRIDRFYVKIICRFILKNKTMDWLFFTRLGGQLYLPKSKRLVR